MYRFLFCLFLLPALADAARQNLLLITIDTLRADYLGCYGNQLVRTPNLDAIAGKGLFFRNAVSPAPLTLPSHTSLMTGLYPYHHGVRDNAGSVSAKQVTLAEILRRNGYHTYAFVSGFPLEHRFGLNQGFDVYNDDFPREKNRSLDFLSQRAADATVKAVLSTNLEEPYFLWVHLYDPHAPYQNGGYIGEINFVDQQIGVLLKNINKDNTIIAVAGDHGEGLGEHDEVTHRIFVYDSTMLVPFFISGPGISAQKVEGQVRLIDFLPTALLLMKLPSAPALDGSALPKNAGASAYLESLFPELELGWSPLRAVRTDEWKFIEAPRPELYNLKEDPQEKTNVLTNRPEIAKKLRAQIPQSAIRNSQSGEISPEMAEQLASLGYISGGPGKADKSIDPKDRIGVWNEIEKAVDLEISNPSQSIVILEQARKKDPGNYMVLSFLAEKYSKTDRLKEAKQMLLSILKSDPENSLALTRIASVCLKEGQPAEAKKWAEVLLKTGNWVSDAELMLARANIALGKPDAAISNLTRVLEIDPRDHASRNDLGNLYLQKAQSNMAMKEFDTVLKYDPKNVQALNGLATCHFLDNDLVSSEKLLNQARKFEPEDVQTQMNLALVYTKQGKIAEAIALYKSVEASSATPLDWKLEAQKRIQELQ